MVRRHEDVVPINPYPPCPCPVPPTPIIPVVSVSSINGMTGDVVLKDLIINDKLVYNGTDSVPITLQDLDLNTAVRYRGARSKQFIDDIIEAEEGDLYYCKDDFLLYLNSRQGEPVWINIKSLIEEENIKSISIDGELLPLSEDGDVEIQKADNGKYGVVKFGNESTENEVVITKRPTDGCMILNFDNIISGTISVDKLKGDLWLKADISVEKPDDID